MQEIVFREDKVFVREVRETEVLNAEEKLATILGQTAFVTPPLEPYTKPEWVLERRMMVNIRIPDTVTIGYKLAYLPLIDVKVVDGCRVAALPREYKVNDLYNLRKNGNLGTVRVQPVDPWEWWMLAHYHKKQISTTRMAFLYAYNRKSNKLTLAPIYNVGESDASFCSHAIIKIGHEDNIWEKEKVLLENLFCDRTNDHWNRWPAGTEVEKHPERNHYVLSEKGKKSIQNALKSFPTISSESATRFFKLL